VKFEPGQFFEMGECKNIEECLKVVFFALLFIVVGGNAGISGCSNETFDFLVGLFK
jgi:hypothetical protein